MSKREYLLICIFFIIGIASRIPFVEHFQSHWDGPQYSIGILHYSLSQETPAPPGYPLYIALGRFFYLFTNDAHIALIVESVLFSGMGAAVFFFVGKKIFNFQTGVIATILFLTGSTFYFFGLSAYEYIITPIITALFAWICYEVINKKQKNKIILFSLLFSLAIGFRPQEMFFITPLYIYTIFNLPLKQKLQVVLLSIILVLLWVVPFLYIVGGINQYIHISLTFSRGALSGVNLVNILIFLPRIIKGYFLSFGILGLAILYYLFKVRSLDNLKIKIIKNKTVIFFLLWIVPCLLFNIFIRDDHAGYQMTYLSALIILLSYSISKIFVQKKLLIAFVIIGSIFNLYWFFHDRDPKFEKPYTPTSFHYSEIKKNDIKFGNKILFIKKNFSSKNTIIITASDYWRPTMYYFPQYEVIDIHGLTTTDPKFSHIIRFSKNWTREEITNLKNQLTINKNIKNILFIDDESITWNVHQKQLIFRLPANSYITEIKNIKFSHTFSYNEFN